MVYSFKFIHFHKIKLGLILYNIIFFFVFVLSESTFFVHHLFINIDYSVVYWRVESKIEIVKFHIYSNLKLLGFILLWIETARFCITQNWNC